LSKVPLIPSAPLSEFGDFDPKELIDDRPQGLERDGSYVPGFSEMRVARDTAMGQYLRGEISADKVPVLPVNLRWARGQDKAGKPDSQKSFSHSRKGYRFVTKDMVGKNDWLREMPGGTQWNAAGHLANGDLELMVCDAKNAARNETARRRETDERMNGLTDSLEQNLTQQGTRAYKGADTYIEKSKGDK
jgi:hypothetical protein